MVHIVAEPTAGDAQQRPDRKPLTITVKRSEASGISWTQPAEGRKARPAVNREHMRSTLIVVNGTLAGINAVLVVFDLIQGLGWTALFSSGCIGANAGAIWFISRWPQKPETRAGERRGWPKELMLNRNMIQDKPKSSAADTTLGFRYWIWNLTRAELRSPTQRTIWHGPEMRCEHWDEREVVRGHAGIHAALLPADLAHDGTDEVPPHARRRARVIMGANGPEVEIVIAGVVERFGKYVLGEQGWRAEWVVIRKLIAPDEQVGLSLEKAFPDVEVIYA